MAEIFLLGALSHKKLLKHVESKLKREGFRCSILNSPQASFDKVKECFRIYSNKIPKLKPLKVADLNIDPETYSMYANNQKVKLRKKEFQLLQFFIANRNKILNRNTILENVWGPNCNPFTNTVDVHIAALRKKLNMNGKTLLKTVHGVGYKFEV